MPTLLPNDAVSFEAYLFLYHSYVSPRLIEATCRAAAACGADRLLFVAKEWFGDPGVPHVPGEADRIVPVADWELLAEHVRGCGEFWLADPELRWLVWAYHEPCLHVGGDAGFIKAFKTAYPAWEREQSPWYGPAGVPVCACGSWWSPSCGGIGHPWRCPNCGQGNAWPTTSL